MKYGTEERVGASICVENDIRKEPNMKYLIDFENVANSGFDGLTDLGLSDELLIFYSEQHSTISIAVHQQLEKSLVRKTYMPIKTGGKNALDFQLVSWLGYEIAQGSSDHFVIISNDTGFDAVVDFWQKRGVDVTRRRSLKKAKLRLQQLQAEKAAAERAEGTVEEDAAENLSKGEKRKADKAREEKAKKAKKKSKAKKTDASKKSAFASLQETVRNLLPEYSDDAEVIANRITENNNKQDLNNSLVKTFGSEKAGRIYKTVKPILKLRKGE